jgi:hypothetical protein
VAALVARQLHACAVVVAAAALVSTPAAGQDTRAGSIAAAQAAKAGQLEPYVPGKTERLAAAVKRQLVETPQGFYPWLDSVYSGGGLTLGAGYRRFYGDRTSWDARGLYSVKQYTRMELSTDAIGISKGRLDLHLVGGWRDATEVSFYGVGGDTAADAKSNFRLKQAFAGGAFHGRGPGAFVFDVAMTYEDFSLESGQGASPSIEDAYTAATAPGLGDNPAFAHGTWSGGFDTRPSPGYARRGGLYALAYDTYFDAAGTYTFDRLQAEVVQHVPILRETWVVSLHGVARTTLGDEQTVPYFLLPALGSGSTLRAYPSWRFRDRHSLLLSGEWRWVPNRMFLDMAIFYDAGKVTARREDLNFDHLKQNFGVGVRFHGPLTTPLRIDVARGSEGVNVVFSGAAPF